MTPPHFYILVIISLLKRTWPFIWTNLNSLHPRIICTKFDWFGLLVLKINIFKNFQCIFTLSLLSPLGEGLSPSFEQTWIPFTQGWFVPSLLKTGPVVLEKKSKMQEFTNGQTLRQVNGQTDAGRSEKLRWAKNKRLRGHIAHLNHIDQLFPCKHLQK
jgi:hypothetical protein